MVSTLEEIQTRLTAFDLFQLLADEPHSFFLDSGMDAPRLGRYSFVGSHPFLIFRSKGTDLQFNWRDRVEQQSGDPFDALREILNRFQSQTPPADLPFIGGVGYFGYPLRCFIEELPSTTHDDLKLPDCYFAFYDATVAFDHLSNQVYLCRLDVDKSYANRHQQQTEKLRSILQSENHHTQLRSEAFKSHASHFTKSPIRSNFSKADYLSTVQRAKAYIASGDIYQVNLSQRLSTLSDLPPPELYACLRQLSPVPYGAYLHCGDFHILSASPERFLHFSLGSRTVETRPIKGTRPRGLTPELDRKLAAELLHSEKDLAELLMIVDLERNDLGRVCEIASIHVPERVALESYSNIHHLVATVRGTLRRDADRIDLLKSCFPGGSITGAPKIRAMELIDELEPTDRGVYTGAIGYFGFDGTMDLNIAIRTCILKEGCAYFHVGGGIVADSEPEAEYQETLDKASSWMAVLEGDMKHE
ncbi:aminodeoxychorismate synthase component I [Candidatus Poribacteria bacterium]|nr:aminodeoxychorismate synthase component I [Candidatus Poribacteria bacterium]